jgi:hypothetical protein
MCPVTIRSAQAAGRDQADDARPAGDRVAVDALDCHVTQRQPRVGSDLHRPAVQRGLHDRAAEAHGGQTGVQCGPTAGCTRCTRRRRPRPSARPRAGNGSMWFSVCSACA